MASVRRGVGQRWALHGYVGASDALLQAIPATLLVPERTQGIGETGWTGEMRLVSDVFEPVNSCIEHSPHELINGGSEQLKAPNQKWPLSLAVREVEKALRVSSI